MNIVWLSWKDIRHPLAGGAESVSFELMKRLARNGHSVKLLTAQYEGAEAHEVMEGIEIFRAGNRYSVYLKAAQFYKKQLRGWSELTIDEMNTIPFFSPFMEKKVPNIMFVHQLAREVWFYQMVFPLSLVGYLLEPIYLRLLSKRYRQTVTVSNSTKKDLEKYGFNNISTIHVGMELKPLPSITSTISSPTNVLILGAMRPMKRTLEGVKAFESAYEHEPSMQLTLVGDASGSYAKKVLDYITSSKAKSNIKVLGRVSYATKIEAMKKADIILVTSIKEGWGLIVTEANSQGTVAIGYNVDGLRDSIVDQKTGLLSSQNNPQSLGATLIEASSDIARFNEMRENAWKLSKNFSYEDSYKSFLQALSTVIVDQKS